MTAAPTTIETPTVALTRVRLERVAE
jgi:hypothetical protein